ncbi:histidine kinase 5 [Humulus lupulus]|uniref:histidine kinase 5 n=1 Tax=Humulus lupulus TaxID=3486 RepID=UPI002B404424|nr:histidine kinase 5 [Humulus lupulus]
MVCEMEETDHRIEEMDIEILPSMWPEDIGFDAGKQFNVERPGQDQDMLEEVTIMDEPTIVDFQRLIELTNYSEKGSSQLTYLVKHWEYKQANAVRLLREELDILSKQREEVELKKLEILEEHRFEEDTYGDKRPISILDGVYDIWPPVPRVRNDVVVQNKSVEIDAEYDTVVYWKQRALHLEKRLQASVDRENALVEKLEESIKDLERQSSPVEELSQILKRADNFLHFVLQNAPVVIGHQDNELRYRFIYNHFPSLHEQDIIGKTDVEIFTGAGVKESQDFKREVLEKKLPAKREITFETELFGSKTFLIYVEPVFSKSGETIGINYMGMDVTDQVRKREKMAKVREELAVQKAKETELNKTIHITEETMRAKQMLATMSHEIRSPLSGVVSMAEILTTTKLDREQRQLLEVMLSSGDLVLQLINDILDLSKVESGVMKLEATKFHPREVVKHVLQTAAASLQKVLTLEGHVADDVPIEVIGDVLRIRQILTNLISNAVKFTHEGKVGIKLYVVPTPSWGREEGCNEQFNAEQSTSPENGVKEEKPKSHHSHVNGSSYQNHSNGGEPRTPNKTEAPRTADMDQDQSHSSETTVWIRCDVYDTGIGIPENALHTLFKRYMQVSADHARKYGGTGLGLAICKQLVELMGGRLTVSSREKYGSTFTFILPYKVSNGSDSSDDSDELSDMANHDTASDDATESYFQFQPHTLGSLFNSNGSSRTQNLLPHKIGFTTSHKPNGLPPTSYAFASSDCIPEETVSVVKTMSEPEISANKENGVFERKKCQDNTKDQLQNTGTDPPTHNAEASKDSLEVSPCQKQGKSEPTVPCSTLEPKILLVEDNKINIMVAQSMMKQLGHSIEVVNNGAEAVKAIQRRPYGLVLMDVHMPVMNGLQATRIIRSFEETGSWEAAKKAGIELSDSSLQNGHAIMPSTKRIPIIAMTANALSESAEECYENGMDSFVSKPVTFQKLKQCLEQFLPP